MYSFTKPRLGGGSHVRCVMLMVQICCGHVEYQVRKLGPFNRLILISINGVDENLNLLWRDLDVV
jgi:hypothetical protein